MLGPGLMYWPVETHDLLTWPSQHPELEVLAIGAAGMYGTASRELRCATDVERIAQRICLVASTAPHLIDDLVVDGSGETWLQSRRFECDVGGVSRALENVQRTSPECHLYGTRMGPRHVHIVKPASQVRIDMPLQGIHSNETHGSELLAWPWGL